LVIFRKVRDWLEMIHVKFWIFISAHKNSRINTKCSQEAVIT